MPFPRIFPASYGFVRSAAKQWMEIVEIATVPRCAAEPKSHGASRRGDVMLRRFAAILLRDVRKLDGVAICKDASERCAVASILTFKCRPLAGSDIVLTRWRGPKAAAHAAAVNPEVGSTGSALARQARATIFSVARHGQVLDHGKRAITDLKPATWPQRAAFQTAQWIRTPPS